MLSCSTILHDIVDEPRAAAVGKIFQKISSSFLQREQPDIIGALGTLNSNVDHTILLPWVSGRMNFLHFENGYVVGHYLLLCRMLLLVLLE